MAQHVVKQGIDIPIAGPASGTPVPLPPPDTIAYSPTEFRGIVPRLAVKVGHQVEVGDVLFFHKENPAIVFRSPVAGHVAEVRRGARRVITDLVIAREGDNAKSFPAHTLTALQALSREDAVDLALSSGLWASIRTRPLNRVADPTVLPQSILISAHESGPLQPGADTLLSAEDADAVQAAVHLLKAICSKVLLASGGAHPALDKLEGVERHTFSGPHPAGDPTVQVNLTDPPRGTNQVWYLRAWEAAELGRFVLTGRFPTERVYAAVGAGVKQPRFVRTTLGAPLSHIVGDAHEATRWVRGSVLTGEAVDSGRWASFYARAVHVLPETVERSILGWALPALQHWSFHRTFLSGFTKPSRAFDLRPGLYGGHRAMVPIGVYHKVMATPDVLPEFLFKAIVAGDLEESVQLGLLDISEEEAALCSYICPSKIEFGVLLRQGLDLYVQET
jgi:Na+-transporting NADH:ubiquinone oxidoreductase subunit A